MVIDCISWSLSSRRIPAFIWERTNEWLAEELKGRWVNEVLWMIVSLAMFCHKHHFIDRLWIQNNSNNSLSRNTGTDDKKNLAEEMSAEESIWSQTKTTAYQTTGYMHFNNLLCITSSCPVLLYSICMHYMPALLCSARLGSVFLCFVRYVHMHMCVLLQEFYYRSNVACYQLCYVERLYMYARIYVCIHMTMYL